MIRPLQDRRAALALAALVLATVALVFVVARSDDRQTVHAQFLNAGRLVEGGEVRVAGRRVGNVEHVGLTPDGRADIELSIDSSEVPPIRASARATIRAVGGATISNNFVEIQPGAEPSPELGDGGVIPADQTTGIVDVDAILSSFDPRARADMRQLFANSSAVFAGTGGAYFNGMLAKLDPALGELHGATRELASERAQLERVITSSADVAESVASRRTDLRAAVTNTARTMNALAGERENLGALLARAPAFFDQGTTTLTNAATTVTALRPALRKMPAVGPPLTSFLGRTRTSLTATAPMLAELRGQLPGLRKSLDGFPALRAPAAAALRSTGTMFARTREPVRGLRVYGSDFVLGIFNGLVGISTGPYNQAGHYAHETFSVPPQAFLDLPQLIDTDLIPGIFGMRKGLTAPCPGGAAPPAPDRSNPWIPDRSLCNPAHDTPESVNSP